MTNLICNTKSGSNWTRNELAAYHIVVKYKNAATFFGMHSLPQPTTINPTVLMATNSDDTADDGVYELLCMMDLTMSHAPAEESAVDNFAVLLLCALGYNMRGRVLIMRKVIPLIICGENRHAKTDG